MGFNPCHLDLIVKFVYCFCMALLVCASQMPHVLYMRGDIVDTLTTAFADQNALHKSLNHDGIKVINQSTQSTL